MINLNRKVCCLNILCLNKIYQDKIVEAHHEKEKTSGNRKVWPLIFTKRSPSYTHIRHIFSSPSRALDWLMARKPAT